MAQPQASSRLAVIARQLSALGFNEDAPGVGRQATKATADEVRPAPGGGRGTLTVVDSRTGKKYTVSTNSLKRRVMPARGIQRTRCGPCTPPGRHGAHCVELDAPRDAWALPGTVHALGIDMYLMASNPGCAAAAGDQRGGHH